MREKLYISPLDFPAGGDAAAIQAAVDEAVRTDIRAVVISKKADGTAWVVDKTILLPSGTTVVLDGCAVEGSCTIFANANAYKEETKSLGGEEHDLYLVGKRGAELRSTSDTPQIYLSNVKDFRVAGITFVSGAGLKLHFARIGKVQQLKFENSKNGIVMSEGCSGLLIHDIEAVTEEETVFVQGGATVLFGRDPDIRKSILTRICAKTSGAPAVGLYAGEVPMSYLIVRDITDRTEEVGVSVCLGETEKEIRDITIRGVDTKRGAVETTSVCDGLHCANLGGSFTAGVPNTRSNIDETREAVALPRFENELEPGEFLTPNDPEFYGETDAQTIQNAVDAAAEQGVPLVIPRWNARTRSTIWDIEKAIVLPSNMTIGLWGCHLRQADFCYENIFQAQDASNITITGVGDAVLDGGKHNGLLEKNAGKYGFGSILNNAMLRFVRVNDLNVEHFRIKQSRWYGMHLSACSNVDIANVDFSTYSLVSDLGGIYVRSGCRDVVIRELTGVVSDDLISLTAQGCDEAVCEEQKHIENVTVRDIKADTRRWSMVRLRNHDGRRITKVTMESMMDVSLAEQKMSPPVGVAIGAVDSYYERKAELGELSGVVVRDFCSRAGKTVAFGGCSCDVTLDNIHSFGGTTSAVAVENSALVHRVTMSDLYFRCDQASGYMRGTATSIITDKKKYRGVALDLGKLKGDAVVDGLRAERVSGAVKLSGGASVTVSGLEVAEYGKFLAACDDQSQLSVNGAVVACGETVT